VKRRSTSSIGTARGARSLVRRAGSRRDAARVSRGVPLSGLRASRKPSGASPPGANGPGRHLLERLETQSSWWCSAARERQVLGGDGGFLPPSRTARLAQGRPPDPRRRPFAKLQTALANAGRRPGHVLYLDQFEEVVPPSGGDPGERRSFLDATSAHARSRHRVIFLCARTSSGSARPTRVCTRRCSGGPAGPAMTPDELRGAIEEQAPRRAALRDGPVRAHPGRPQERAGAMPCCSTPCATLGPPSRALAAPVLLRAGDRSCEGRHRETASACTTRSASATARASSR